MWYLFTLEGAICFAIRTTKLFKQSNNSFLDDNVESLTPNEIGK